MIYGCLWKQRGVLQLEVVDWGGMGSGGEEEGCGWAARKVAGEEQMFAGLKSCFVLISY